MSFWAEFWRQVGITAPQFVATVAASVICYLVLTSVLRSVGQRLYANRSGTGLAVVLVLGAVTGRAMLGPGPTLLVGLTALATLVVMESFFGTARRSGLIGHRRAVVLYARGSLVHDQLRHYHVTENMLWQRLRGAGIRCLDEVWGIILETDGSLTVIRCGAEPDPRLLTNVRGAELLLDD